MTKVDYYSKRLFFTDNVRNVGLTLDKETCQHVIALVGFIFWLFTKEKFLLRK